MAGGTGWRLISRTSSPRRRGGVTSWNVSKSALITSAGRLHGAKTSELFSIIQICNPCRARADSNLCKNPATRTTVLINMDQFDVLAVSVRVRVSPRPSSSSFFSSHPLKLDHLTDQLPLSRCSNPSVDLQGCDRVQRLPTEYWRIDIACIDNGISTQVEGEWFFEKKWVKYVQWQFLIRVSHP